MDDTFSFRAPLSATRRRVDPWIVKLALAALASLISLGSFAKLVIDSEHRSDARAGILPAAEAPALAESPGSADVASSQSQDGPARAAATAAVALAMRAFEHDATFEAATTARLAKAGSGMIFVDGASTGPAIVSVTAADTSWAAAVMSASGTCFWVRADATGAVRYGTGLPCTGRAATMAGRTAW